MFVVFQDLSEKDRRGGERESTAALGELVVWFIGMFLSMILVRLLLNLKQHPIFLFLLIPASNAFQSKEMGLVCVARVGFMLMALSW